MTSLASCGGGGDEDVGGEPTVVQPLAGTFTAVSAGGDHTCGILDTGAVTCWGLDDQGQSTPPTDIFTAVNAGGDHTCGILDTGDVACWGLDEHGQATPSTGTFTALSAGGDHTCGILDTGGVTCWGLDEHGQSTTPTGTFTAMSAGGDHTCGILDTGDVACWGLDEHGQATPSTGTFTALSAGGDHTCGILDTGDVTCWGLDEHGQSTLSTDIFTAVSAGGDHTCGILDTGDVACWGLDDQGQSTPPAGTFTAVSAGGDRTCGILDTGAVTCWGLDDQGQPAPPDPAAKTDLVVHSPRVSDNSPRAGASFILSVTLRNNGVEVSAPTTLRYYRSTDAMITASDTAVGTDPVGALSPSGTGPQSISLMAPSTAGTYYYGACVDAVTDESDTNNNCSASVQVDVAAPQHPDLTVGSPSVDDASPETGGTFALSATVSNDGDAEAPATTLRYYRSTDATITSSDTEVGTDAVAALAASGTSSGSVDLTAPSTTGTYYYGACVDAVTDESDTTNNCSALVQVEVAAPSISRPPPRPPPPPPPPPQQPDLAVVAFFLASGVHDGAPGRPLTFQGRIRNVGNVVSPATTLRFYRSRNRTIATDGTFLGSVAVGTIIASRRIDSETLTLTALSAPGTYYYGACVDAVAGESDTTNNCSDARPITVEGPPPDLVVLAPDVGEIQEDGKFFLLVTVHNQGAGGAAATTVRYKRSTDGTISTSDTTVGTDALSALFPLTNYGGTIRLTAPSTPGTYYYGGCVDAVPRESDTTNNCSTTSASLTVN